jgi:hypothetical protein
MPWLKSPLAQIAGLSLAMAVLMPLAVPGATRHFIAYSTLGVMMMYAVPIALAHWMAADLRARGRTPPFELPFLLMIVWPLSLFWYCIWTRGPQGLLLALGLFFLAYLPYIATSVFWLAWLLLTQ